MLSVTQYVTLKWVATSSCHFWSEGTLVWGMKLANKNQGNKSNFHFHLKIYKLWCSEQHGIVKKHVFHLTCFYRKYNLEKEQMLKIYLLASWIFGNAVKKSLNLKKKAMKSCFSPVLGLTWPKRQLYDILTHWLIETFCSICPNSQNFQNKAQLLSSPLVPDYKLSAFLRQLWQWLI